ncbi:STAS domain-containing protein [Paenibacillus alginolyticus]|uniref:Anti-sigma factor antagonist n=1 Tax=Paenibacillus alginolyticus TaxID=59839 RepID=A0ABT4GQ53_9BACL|nr:STAS domain-containing protein [Paenibacillus alginolyticus]MCY9698360.1 STAS domain-containing protein [Paenibacillus alginolyticus]MEC0147719.1 STAS domain-containing protein [Paenibacillus alginolyticus]
MFKYKLLDEGTITIVSFAGDMDIDVTELIEEELSPLLMNKKEIQIDFSEVPFVDSSGIGLLITLVKNLQEKGNKVQIMHIRAEVKQVFAMLELSEILGNDVLNDFHDAV